MSCDVAKKFVTQGQTLGYTHTWTIGLYSKIALTKNVDINAALKDTKYTLMQY